MTQDLPGSDQYPFYYPCPHDNSINALYTTPSPTILATPTEIQAGLDPADTSVNFGQCCVNYELRSFIYIK